MRQPTRRQQRQARRALLRQIISVGFAVVIASAARPR